MRDPFTSTARGSPGVPDGSGVERAKTSLATKLGEKTDKLNCDNFWQAQGKGDIEEEVVPGLTDSTLTASDLAMLQGGANSEPAMKLAEFKRKLNKIKGSNNDILKAGLVAYKLDITGLKPTLQARLFLATAIEYGHGVLPDACKDAPDESHGSCSHSYRHRSEGFPLAWRCRPSTRTSTSSCTKKSTGGSRP